MPWTLRYSNDLDGRVTRNGHRALFMDSGDVESVNVLQFPVPGLTVHFRSESTQTDSPALRRIYEQYGVREQVGRDGMIDTPFQHRPMEGFRLLPLRPNQNGDVIPPDVREQIINQYLANPDARARLGQSMAMPLRQRIDYQSIGRRAFLVDQLPEGALPTYDRDPGIEDLPPVGEPFVPPAWVRIGQWVRSYSGGRVACITKVTDRQVEAEIWRESEVQSWYSTTFSSSWAPCEKPAEPRSAWERILDADDV